MKALFCFQWSYTILSARSVSFIIAQDTEKEAWKSAL